MVETEELKDYIDKQDGLVSITPTYSIPKGDEGVGLFNTRLVEIYNYDQEGDADNRITYAKGKKEFLSVQKKYKEPKLNKKGEVIREGYYEVKIIYKAQY